MTPDRLKEIETWATAMQHDFFPFSLDPKKVSAWVMELAAEVRRQQAERPEGREGDTVHLVAETGLGYVGRLVDCAEARRAHSSPCPLCKEAP